MHEPGQLRVKYRRGDAEGVNLCGESVLQGAQLLVKETTTRDAVAHMGVGRSVTSRWRRTLCRTFALLHLTGLLQIVCLAAGLHRKRSGVDSIMRVAIDSSISVVLQRVPLLPLGLCSRHALRVTSRSNRFVSIALRAHSLRMIVTA